MIEDTFNLFGIREIIGQNFKKCLDIVLDRTDASADERIERQCEDLYGLIHARFVITKRGQDLMRRKMRDGDFGHCPRLCCEGQPVLPYGPRDELDIHGVLMYCPRCNEVMYPTCRSAFRAGSNVEIDGAYFGSTFAHLFLMQFPELWPCDPVNVEPFVPRVFGYKVRLPPRPKVGGAGGGGESDSFMVDGHQN